MLQQWVEDTEHNLKVLVQILTIVNLEDTLNPGSIYKVIEIDDLALNE